MKKPYVLFSRKGFTVGELLAASLLTGMAIAAIYTVYIFANETWLKVSVQAELQEKATYGLERMVRGVDGNYKGVQEAQSVTIPAVAGSGNQILFVDSENGAVSRSFYLSGDDVMYQNESAVTSVLVNGDVQTLTFSQPQAGLIRINLILQRAVLGGTSSINLFTSVDLRND